MPETGEWKERERESECVCMEGGDKERERDGGIVQAKKIIEILIIASLSV